MNAFRALLSIPFRLLAMVSGVVSATFLVIGIGFSLVGDVFGGDRS